MKNSIDQLQVKIEHYTDEEFERVTKEVLEDLSDNAEQIKKARIMKELRETEDRIYMLKRKAMHEYQERKQQHKLFAWEEESGKE